MKAMALWMGVLAVAVLGIGIMGTGCESTGTVNDALVISPNSTSIVGEASATFVASAATTNTLVVLPLEWSVADGSLGRILSVGGMTAVYKSYDKSGATAVIVRDQVGQEGVASITQTETPEIVVDGGTAADAAL